MNRAELRREIMGWVSLLAIVVLLVAPIMVLLNHAVLKPQTDHPQAEWVAVVNAEKQGFSGYVPTLYRADFDDGTTCLLAMGLFVDDLECFNSKE